MKNNLKECPFFGGKCVNASKYVDLKHSGGFTDVAEVDADVIIHFCALHEIDGCKKSCGRRPDKQGRLQPGFDRIMEYIKSKMNEEK